MQRLEKLQFYTRLSNRTQSTLKGHGRVINVPKGGFLFHVRQKVDYIYVILSGYAVLDRESDVHGVKSVFLLGPGDFVNEVILDMGTASITCKAFSRVDVLAIHRRTVLELMEQDFAFNKTIVDSMALKIRRLYHMVESSTKGTKLDHQTASRIWKFAKDYGVKKQDCIELPFEVRITMLAGFLGSNRETISRIVKKMSDEGILSISKGKCKIYDIERLRNYGN